MPASLCLHRGVGRRERRTVIQGLSVPCAALGTPRNRAAPWWHKPSAHTLSAQPVHVLPGPNAAAPVGTLPVQLAILPPAGLVVWRALGLPHGVQHCGFLPNTLQQGDHLGCLLIPEVQALQARLQGAEAVGPPDGSCLAWREGEKGKGVGVKVH